MQTITANTYKNFKYTFANASRTITVYDLFDTQLSFDSLALLTVQRNGASFPLYAPSLSTVSSIGYSVPPTAPTAGVPSIGGSITLGLHSYAYSYVIGSSETLISAKSNVVSATTTNKTVSITVPLGLNGTVSRNVYRTNAGDTSSYYLVGSINNNTGTTFTDTFADNQTTIAPTTSNAFDITYTTANTLLSTDTIVIEVRNTDQTYDLSLGIQKTIPQVLSELPPVDPENPVNDANLALGTYYYELPVSNYRNYVGNIIASNNTSGSTINVFATIDTTAAVPATNGTPGSTWIDVTNDIFGASSITVPVGQTYQNIRSWSIDANKIQVMYDRYLVKYKVNNATNSIIIYNRKF